MAKNALQIDHAKDYECKNTKFSDIYAIYIKIVFIFAASFKKN
jgi:hypothetical protein